MTVRETERPATYREVFAEPRFRVLFLTRSTAIAADSLRILALSVLVFSVTGSPLLGALAFGIGFLPQVVGGLLLGAIADRVPPRRLIAAGYALEALLAVLLALLRLPVGWCLVMVAVVACLTPVFNGAGSRLTAEVLTGDAYVLGRAVSNMSSSAAQLIGLAGGGIAVSALGPRHALLVAASCHVAAALGIRLGLPDLPVPDRSGETSALRASWTGAGRLLGDRGVRGLLLAQWLPAAFSASAEALLIPYASLRGFSASAAGALLAALPVGMLVGDFLVGRFVRPAVRERLSAPLVVVIGAPLPVLLAHPPLPLAVGLLALSGAGFAYALGLQRAFLDAVPVDARGQAFALLLTGLMTLQGVAPLVSGIGAEISSPAVAIAAAGVATLVIVPILGRALRPYQSWA